MEIKNTFSNSICNPQLLLSDSIKQYNPKTKCLSNQWISPKQVLYFYPQTQTKQLSHWYRTSNLFSNLYHPTLSFNNSLNRRHTLLKLWCRILYKMYRQVTRQLQTRMKFKDLTYHLITWTRTKQLQISKTSSNNSNKCNT